MTETVTIYEVVQGTQMDCRGGEKRVAAFRDRDLAEALVERHKDDWCPPSIRTHTFVVLDGLPEPKGR